VRLPGRRHRLLALTLAEHDDQLTAGPVRTAGLEQACRGV